MYTNAFLNGYLSRFFFVVFADSMRARCLSLFVALDGRGRRLHHRDPLELVVAECQVHVFCVC